MPLLVPVIRTVAMVTPICRSSRKTGADAVALGQRTAICSRRISMRFQPRPLLFAGVGYMPDVPRSVVGDEEGAVFGFGYAYRAAPDGAVGQDEAGEKVLVLAGCVAVLHGQADNFVAGALGTVPGAVFGGEPVAFKLGWKLRPFIEHHLQRGKVGVHQDVRGEDFRLQFRMFAGMSGVLQPSARAVEVEPWPAVKSVFFDVGHVVGNQVVPQAVALICRAPELASRGVDGFPDAVAKAAGVNLDELALRREFKHVSAMELLGVGVGVVN